MTSIINENYEIVNEENKRVPKKSVIMFAII